MKNILSLATGLILTEHGAGYAATEPGILDALVRAADSFRNNQ